jgi:polysaccharide deacetylase family protein (PEP-CTERM system associated)
VQLAAGRRKLPRVRYADLVEEELDLGSPTFVSVDVEDYYHEVPGGEEVFVRDGLPSHLARNTDRLLDLFADRDVQATFFVLSCAASRLLRQLDRMVDEGHEVACHGYAHGRATWMKPQEFREDIRRAKATLEDFTGQEVRGYRAPYFAVTEQSLWTLDEIRNAGFHYDSSVCPVKNFAYGIPDAPEGPHRLRNGLIELPLPQTKLLGYRFMVGGGFYLRAYPFWFTRLLLRLRDSALPRVFYIHTWELDDKRMNLWDLGVDLPGLKWKPRLMKWITTYNRRSTLARFERLLTLGRPGIPLDSAVRAPLARAEPASARRRSA